MYDINLAFTNLCLIIFIALGRTGNLVENGSQGLNLNLPKANEVNFLITRGN